MVDVLPTPAGTIACTPMVFSHLPYRNIMNTPHHTARQNYIKYDKKEHVSLTKNYI